MLDDIVGTQEINFLIALGLSLVCGLLVGGERELKDKPAGISTQTLVISGAMTFTFLSQEFGAGDPTRIAAQIVSGIGFLGAGLILKSEEKKRIDNVTTAASIWYSAGLGMALGFGFYFVAVMGAIYAVVVSRIPNIPLTHKGRSKKDI
jgi:putative Mg2+ transporter-C (MgtC) family protein